MREVKPNTNSTVDDRERRRLLHCSMCKPHRRENSTRRIPRSDRYKNHRR